MNLRSRSDQQVLLRSSRQRGRTTYCCLFRDVMLGGLLIPTLSGCSILFDAPSQDGVQIVKSAVRAVGNGESASSPQPSSGVLDLTHVRGSGQTVGATNACGQEKTRKVEMTSSDAVRDLQERAGKTAAEKKLVQAIAYFNSEKIDQARRSIDSAPITELRRAADRAVAYMYLGFIHCIDFNKTACALEFRRMYAEMPGYLVTDDAPGNRKWSSVLQEVTAQYPGGAKAAAVGLTNAPAAPSPQMYSALLVSKTTDGSSQLLLNVRPGGSIVFDGQVVGEAPPVRLIKVNPGVHSFALSSGRTQPFAVDVDVGVGEQIEIRHGVQ